MGHHFGSMLQFPGHDDGTGPAAWRIPVVAVVCLFCFVLFLFVCLFVCLLLLSSRAAPRQDVRAGRGRSEAVCELSDVLSDVLSVDG